MFWGGLSGRQRWRPSNPVLRADCRDESGPAPDFDVVVFDDALGVLFGVRVVSESEFHGWARDVAVTVQFVKAIFDCLKVAHDERPASAGRCKAKVFNRLQVQQKYAHFSICRLTGHGLAAMNSISLPHVVQFSCSRRSKSVFAMIEPRHEALAENPRPTWDQRGAASAGDY